MLRNIKALGLALAAVMAMSAVVVSATASADEFTSEVSPKFMEGNQAGFGDVLTTTAGTVKCKQITYLSGAISTPTTTLNVIPIFPLKALDGSQNCTGFGFPLEILTNSCTYKFTIGGSTSGGLDIVCPEGKEITMIATSGLTTKCVLHIPAQNIASGVTYSNVGSGTTREINIAMNISGAISYSHTPGEGVGKCTFGSSGTGSYVGSARLRGFGLPHVGFFLS